MSLRRLALAALLALLAVRVWATSPTLPAPWMPADPGVAIPGVSVSPASPHGGTDTYGFLLRNRALLFEFSAGGNINSPKPTSCMDTG